MVMRAVELQYGNEGKQPVSFYTQIGAANLPVEATRSFLSKTVWVRLATNTACEGFFGLLKREHVNHRRYQTRNEAWADVFDYLEKIHIPRMLRRPAAQDIQIKSFLNRP